MWPTQGRLQSPLSGQLFWSIMASAAECSGMTFYTAEQVLELLEDDENVNEGMSSD